MCAILTFKLLKTKDIILKTKELLLVVLFSFDNTVKAAGVCCLCSLCCKVLWETLIYIYIYTERDMTPTFTACYIIWSNVFVSISISYSVVPLHFSKGYFTVGVTDDML